MPDIPRRISDTILVHRLTGERAHPKECGGTVLVQSKATSAFFEMPSAAIQTGAVDFIVPAEEIAHALVVLCTPAADSPPTERTGTANDLSVSGERR